MPPAGRTLKSLTSHLSAKAEWSGVGGKSLKCCENSVKPCAELSAGELSHEALFLFCLVNSEAPHCPPAWLRASSAIHPGWSRFVTVRRGTEREERMWEQSEAPHPRDWSICLGWAPGGLPRGLGSILPSGTRPGLAVCNLVSHALGSSPSISLCRAPNGRRKSRKGRVSSIPSSTLSWLVHSRLWRREFVFSFCADQKMHLEFTVRGNPHA